MVSADCYGFWLTLVISPNGQLVALACVHICANKKTGRGIYLSWIGSMAGGTVYFVCTNCLLCLYKKISQNITIYHYISEFYHNVIIMYHYISNVYHELLSRQNLIYDMT